MCLRNIVTNECHTMVSCFRLLKELIFLVWVCEKGDITMRLTAQPCPYIALSPFILGRPLNYMAGPCSGTLVFPLSSPWETIFILKNKGRKALLKHGDILPCGAFYKSISPLYSHMLPGLVSSATLMRIHDTFWFMRDAWWLN